MKAVTVGTAGHIDHGKTALVKALTGIDADRLEEEKRRGITIDLGFAHMEMPGLDGETLRLGFVDMPGHERFVRNMLAGVGGIDLVMFVVAADEGIKPQSREHFDICRLLAVERGITVLTKSDVVDAEMLDLVRLEVGEFLQGSFLDPARAPMVAVSSLTGSGLEELRTAVARVASNVPARDSKALARLPIDRVFSMKGFGTIVTGTLVTGTIQEEEELEVFPGGQRVRVRGVQVHGAATAKAVAGERTALNITGATKSELTRGMVLVPPGIFCTTQSVDVQIDLLDSARALKDRAQVHFHASTMEVVAEVRLFGAKQIAPGERAFGQLRLAEPTMLLPGDRFILRQFSPVVTIGGGVVIENAPPRKIRGRTEYAEFLRGLAASDQAGALRTRIAAGGVRGLTTADAMARTGWRRGQVEALAGKIEEVALVEDVLINRDSLDDMRKGLGQALEEFHAKNPLVSGMSKEELRGHFPEAHPQVFERVLGDAVLAKEVEVSGELVRLPGRGVAMKDDEAESKQIIERAFASAGLKVPAMKDVLAGLKVDRVRAHKIVTLLLRDKVLIKLSEDLVFHQSALAHLRAQVAGLKAKSPKIDVARFKELTGVSRKYAIPLLEYLDRERVTRRVGDERVIL